LAILATSAGQAGTSVKAASSGYSGTAQIAILATSANNSGTSVYATSSGQAGTAVKATSSGNAGTSLYATSSGQSGTSLKATSSGNAGTAMYATSSGTTNVSALAPLASPTFTGTAASPVFRQTASSYDYYGTFAGTNCCGSNVLAELTTQVNWYMLDNPSNVFGTSGTAAGHFRAPVDGLYYLHWNLSPQENNILSFFIVSMSVHGGRQLAGINKVVGKNILYSIGAQEDISTTVYLTAGQSVSVTINYTNDDNTKTMELSGFVRGCRII
jgi:hypothetical protein